MSRTVGFELEISDVKRDDVCLPSGYSWSKEETLYGINGKRQSPTSSIGGEVNTRPLSFTHADMDELRNVFSSLMESGGHVMWCNYFHCHVYVGDFTLEELKNIFILSYYVNQYIKDYCNVKPYREFKLCCPTPTFEYVEKCKNADSFASLENVFKNNSNKGYIRHLVNINAYWKHKTVEFRMFASTNNFDELVASAFFAVRFVNYAKTHTEEDFKNIKSLDDFKRKLKIHFPVSKVLPHFINAGDQMSEQDRFVSRVLKYSSPMIKLITENCGDEICCVNPNLYSLELSLFNKLKKLVIYNNNQFNDIIYRVATEDFKISYTSKLGFLEQYKDGTPEMELTLLLLFHRLRKFTGDNEYAKRSLDAMISVFPESIKKTMTTSSNMIEMLRSCDYFKGTVNDALAKEKVVFYQYEDLPKLRSSVQYLRKLSDFNGEFEEKLSSYNLIDDQLVDGKVLLLASKNQYLSLNKLGAVNNTILYSNINPDKTKVITSHDEAYHYAYKMPPDDIIINDPSKLMIVPAQGKQFSILQHAFVKKVDTFSSGRFQYIVYYDGYVLGAFAFDYPKLDGYDLWLLSDFTTNNNVKRLSKLILLCIKSSILKKILSRKLRLALDSMYTKVYTTRPVSMKYRGQFKKVKVDGVENGLVYESQFGASGSYNDIINEYQKIINR